MPVVIAAWAHAVAHRGRLGVGVLADYRGQGIGRQLLEACIARAWANGLTRIELEVRADNTRAAHLYRQLGFTPEGTQRRAMRVDGRYHDTLLMALLRDEG